MKLITDQHKLFDGEVQNGWLTSLMPFKVAFLPISQTFANGSSPLKIYAYSKRYDAPMLVYYNGNSGVTKDMFCVFPTETITQLYGKSDMTSGSYPRYRIDQITNNGYGKFIKSEVRDVYNDSGNLINVTPNYDSIFPFFEYEDGRYPCLFFASLSSSSSIQFDWHDTTKIHPRKWSNPFGVSEVILKEQQKINSTDITTNYPYRSYIYGVIWLDYNAPFEIDFRAMPSNTNGVWMYALVPLIVQPDKVWAAEHSMTRLRYENAKLDFYDITYQNTHTSTKYQVFTNISIPINSYEDTIMPTAYINDSDIILTLLKEVSI
ncbi:MAG: hypothetical protein KatS3mg003_1059 [Candidatus Nitrosocaldaceae archaeon]|nr:MAG: hypothetical protein KatS3mg003_1059 [Candidatus Nitrosocaldaceae archaeon]